MLARIIVTVAALVVIVYGVVAALTPLPAGVFAVALGLVTIALANPRTRPLLRAMRRRWRWFDAMVRIVAEHAPERYQDPLHETDPGPARAPDETTDEKERAQD